MKPKNILFSHAQWIWCDSSKKNQYHCFYKKVEETNPISELHIRIAAMYHYKLFINGTFYAYGPVPAAPEWIQYDTHTISLDQSSSQWDIAIIAHYSKDTYLHYLCPSNPGLIAEIHTPTQIVGSNTSWKVKELEMWQDDVPDRGWATDYLEIYDAQKEADGCNTTLLNPLSTEHWKYAQEQEESEFVSAHFQERMIPAMQYAHIHPIQMKVWQTPEHTLPLLKDISSHADTEPLQALGAFQKFSLTELNQALQEGNAFTLDLGKEYIGFYHIELDAPEGRVLEISGAELLQDKEERPWIFRKNSRYSMRYTTTKGHQAFTSFTWNGFRYMHVVIRGNASTIRIKQVSCYEKKPVFPDKKALNITDPILQKIADLCDHTLEVGVQEHLIDCPTREQAQYWGDAVFIAQSVYRRFNEPAYLQWYLECYLRVPLNEYGQISCTYPGNSDQVLLDYSMIPLIGQQFYYENFNTYYKPEATLTKALEIKKWYDAHLNEQGLISFDFDAYFKKGLRNFIDHPGIGWHNFPHPGIDRQGVSCPLNIFYYGFIQILARICLHVDQNDQADQLTLQAEKLQKQLVQVFYKNGVFHDAIDFPDPAVVSAGTSWQTNALAVFFDLIPKQQAQKIMQHMLDGYDSLCRCSPYFHFYFLPALQKVGWVEEAKALIKKEWNTMLERDATTTWEGFLGDEKDSLCHPWSTAPLLFLLDL